MLLSILIPVFNRQSSLDLLLLDLYAAITKGRYEEVVEVIVIDDCSPIPVVISESQYVVKLLRNEENKGAPFSRERGLGLATGSFIHFHDSDDSFSDNWLSRILQELKSFPETDFLLTAREICDEGNRNYHFQKFFNKNHHNPRKIKHRLIYQNCIGPLGGVTFSRRVLQGITFENYSSCQDWQMYLAVMPAVKTLKSLPDIVFKFNISGKDRISHNPTKKLLGHLQLSKITSGSSFFKRNIRYFYFYNCKSLILRKKSGVLKYYQKNKIKIFVYYVLINVHWRVTDFFK